MSPHTFLTKSLYTSALDRAQFDCEDDDENKDNDDDDDFADVIDVGGDGVGSDVDNDGNDNKGNAENVRCAKLKDNNILTADYEDNLMHDGTNGGKKSSFLGIHISPPQQAIGSRLQEIAKDFFAQTAKLDIRLSLLDLRDKVAEILSCDHIR